MRPDLKNAGFLLLSLLLILPAPALAGGKKGLEEGDRLFKEGRYAEAADRYYAATLADPEAAQEALVKTGRALDRAVSGLYEEADSKCYLNKKRGEAKPECFEAVIRDLNRRYGEGSFSYHGDQVQFTYNATHFGKLLEKFPEGPYRDEAGFALLRGAELLGDDPDEVCRKVERWIQTYPKSALMPRALLLLGRLRADAFVTFKRGGIVLINGRVDPEGTSQERSRQQTKGLAAFKEIIDKYPDSPERGAAEREHRLLKEGKDDGIFYGITY